MRCVAGLHVLDDARPRYSSANNATVTFEGTNFIVNHKPVVVQQFDLLVSRATTCWRAKWANPRQRTKSGC
jgi:hypothetical protein